MKLSIRSTSATFRIHLPSFTYCIYATEVMLSYSLFINRALLYFVNGSTLSIKR